MSLLRTALLGGSAAAATLVAAAAALLPDGYTVERSIVVAAEPATIVPLVADFPARHAWIPWTDTDPAAVYSYTGQPGAVGSTMRWDGEVIGAATLTLDTVDVGRVVTTLAMTSPLATTSRDVFTFTPAPGGTRVTWTNQATDLPFGPARAFALVADGVLGADYEAGLVRLRDHVERFASN
jgi:Polyketide cyclase / dehydrase and lipid transport